MANKRQALTEQQVLAIAGALADPRRYELLKLMAKRDGTASCELLRGCVDIRPATLSHHMKELEQASLVAVERKGKFAHYRLRRDVLRDFFATLRQDLI
jgi:ArsR family transcriptional regulator